MLVALLFAGARPLRAQVERVYLDDVAPVPDGERAVELYFRALSPAGAPVKNLGPGELEIWEDDRRIPVEELKLVPLEQAQLGVSAALALDASGTMQGTPFARAKEASLRFLDRLQSEDRVAVLAFAEDVRGVADFSRPRVETRQLVSELAIDVGRSKRSYVLDAAYEAIDRIRSAPGLPRRSFAIVLADGKDSGSQHNAEQVIAHAKSGDGRPPVLLFTIGYPRFGREGMEPLRALAEATGGRFCEASAAARIAECMEAIAAQLHASYLVRFPTDLDGERHELRLSVQDRQSLAEAVYPRLARPLLPWLLGAAALLALVGALVWFFVRPRIAGRVAVISGAKSGVVYELRPGRNRIGALADNDIVLLSNLVSRYHAEIVTRGRRVQISDLRSTNGTRVNGQVVQQSPLRVGDRIAIADVELVYER